MNDSQTEYGTLTTPLNELQNLKLSPTLDDTSAFEKLLTHLQQDPKSSIMLEKGMVSAEFLRARLPTAWDLYCFLRDVENIYLPPWKSKNTRPTWAQGVYFEGILTGRYFFIRRNQVKGAVPKIKKQSQGDLIRYLEEEADKPLGFKPGRDPPGKWMVKLLYSLNPEHKIFKPVVEKLDKEIPREILEKLMLLPVIRGKGAKLFGKNPDERKQRQLEKLAKMKEKAVALMQEEKRRVKMKRRKIEMLEQMSQELVNQDRSVRESVREKSVKTQVDDEEDGSGSDVFMSGDEIS